jgi:hypothetical protein
LLHVVAHVIDDDGEAGLSTRFDGRDPLNGRLTVLPVLFLSLFRFVLLFPVLVLFGWALGSCRGVLCLRLAFFSRAALTGVFGAIRAFSGNVYLAGLLSVFSTGLLAGRRNDEEDTEQQ